MVFGHGGEDGIGHGAGRLTAFGDRSQGLGDLGMIEFALYHRRVHGVDDGGLQVDVLEPRLVFILGVLLLARIATMLVLPEAVKKSFAGRGWQGVEGRKSGSVATYMPRFLTFRNAGRREPGAAATERGFFYSLPGLSGTLGLEDVQNLSPSLGGFPRDPLPCVRGHSHPLARLRLAGNKQSSRPAKLDGCGRRGEHQSGPTPHRPGDVRCPSDRSGCRDGPGR